MQERGLTAAILAGGLGTRLRSALPGRPKVLAPVAGRPHIEHLLEQITAAGISRAVLLVGHLADQVRDVLGDEACGVSLEYSAEPSPLGTGGAVAYALPLLRDQRVLLLNGDSHCDADLGAFVRWHVRRRAEASMLLAQVEDAGRFGRVEAEDGYVMLFTEKGRPGPGWINAGVYVIKPGLLESLPGGVFSLEQGVFPLWAREGRLAAYESTARFIDIGTPESFALAGRHFALTARRAAG
jgi:NDP-sugar pyrophosphorylase family protein